MDLRKFTCVAALAVLLSCLPAAKGEVVLDQQMGWVSTNHSGAAAINSEYTIAQTFTVGVTGTLSRIDLPLWRSQGLTGELKFQLLPVTAGRPDAFALHPQVEIDIDVATLPEDGAAGLPPVPSVTSFDLSAYGIPVQPGDQWAIYLSREEATNSGPPWVTWTIGKPDAGYAAGGSFLRNVPDEGLPDGPDGWEDWSHMDMMFSTFVLVPEPASYALAALGMIGLLAFRRRKTPRP
jgi:hypothetical protein